MDAQRAQDIINSPDMVNVSFNGSLVYLEQVDQERDLATVHPLNDPNSKQSVPVNKLIEEH